MLLFLDAKKQNGIYLKTKRNNEVVYRNANVL